MGPVAKIQRPPQMKFEAGILPMGYHLIFPKEM